MPAKVYLSCLLVAAFMFTYCSPHDSHTACIKKVDECEKEKIPYGQYICGSDNETYDNICQLMRINCTDMNIHVKYNGKCTNAIISEKLLQDSMEPEVASPPCLEDVAKLLSNDIVYGKYGMNAEFIPKCTDNGYYKSIQCENVSHECWCSDPQGNKMEKLGIIANKILICPKNGCNVSERNKFRQKILHIIRTEFRKNKNFSDFRYHKRARKLKLDSRAVLWKFLSLDKNKDNKLTKDEYQLFKKDFRKYVKSNNCSKLFVKICDTDTDKTINITEWNSCPFLVDTNKSSRKKGFQNKKSVHGHKVNKTDFPTFSELPLYTKEKTEDSEVNTPVTCNEVRETVLKSNQDINKIYVPQCDENGLYKLVQCYSKSVMNLDFCFCAFQDTGDMIENTGVLGIPKCDAYKILPRKPMKGCDITNKVVYTTSLVQYIFELMKLANHPDSNTLHSRDVLVQPMILSVGFNYFDRNSDGFLTKPEWKLFREAMISRSLLKRCGKKILRHCDANEDSKVSLFEWNRCFVDTLAVPIISSNNKKLNGRRGSSLDLLFED